MKNGTLKSSAQAKKAKLVHDPIFDGELGSECDDGDTEILNFGSFPLHEEGKPEGPHVLEEAETIDDEEEVEVDEIQMFGYLVDQMIEMEEFFRLSMQHDNDLSDYLQQTPDDLAIMQGLSKKIQNYISDSKTMDEYLLAFENMLNTNGYSMIKFMQEHQSLAYYLQDQIGLIEEIYTRFLKYQVEKLEAENVDQGADYPAEDESTYLSFSQNHPLKKRGRSSSYVINHEKQATQGSLVICFKRKAI